MLFASTESIDWLLGHMQCNLTTVAMVVEVWVGKLGTTYIISNDGNCFNYSSVQLHNGFEHMSVPYPGVPICALVSVLMELMGL